MTTRNMAMVLWVLVGSIAFSTSTSRTYAQDVGTVLGTGTESLVGGDLTDPEDDGDPEADDGYNAIFRSNEEPGFAGGEFSFNVFDNILGPGNDKWCCGASGGISEGEGLWVEAELLSPAVVLTSFTVSSANDVPNRDPTHWAILGSNDGENYDTIFEHDGDSLWGDTRFQVIQFSSGTDYAAPDPYKIFRMATFDTASAPNGAYFQIGEIEFFGVEGVAGVKGDFNGDGVLDAADFQVLLDTFGTSVDRGEAADINFSGNVDLADFLEFRIAFDSPAAEASSIPEPGSLILIGFAAVGLLISGRRRRKNV